MTRVRLRAEAGPLAGAELVWTEHDVVLFGRSPECQIRLPETDVTASRHHAVLEVQPPNAQLRDLGSRNGTLVNGVRYGGRAPDETPAQGALTRHPDVTLFDGDRVEIGAHTFVVALDGPPATEAFPDDPTRGEERRLEEFVVERLLGRGGFGTVSLARRHGSGEAVALKVMLPRVATSDLARRRFLREAATQGRLEHPNIVRLHDAGEDGDALWFTMEYCDGGSLTDLLQARGTLPVGDLMPIALDVLAGLAHAHDAGIVHRDLKPPNVLLAADSTGGWTAKVADLGLAKSFVDAGLSGMTVTGSYAGSWSFMPREQLCDFRHVRPTGDVWSFAATLYLALTGSTPRDETGFADPASAVLSAPVVPIAQRGVPLPAAIAREIDRALATDPGARHPDAGALRRALAAAHH